MKKLLILATLLLVLVVTVVACQPGTNPEDTTVNPDVTVEPATDAPTEEPTEEPTVEPGIPTETVEEPTETAEPTVPTETEEPTVTTKEPEVPTVDPDAPLHIVEPDFLANYAAQTGNLVCVSDVASAEVKTEGSRTFIRLTAGGGDPYIAFIDGQKNLPIARYMVVSYRTNSTMDGQFFMGSGGGWTGSGDSFGQAWNEDGNWNLAIIDLDNVGITSLENYILNYARCDFFAGAGNDGDYFDIEYIAFFNSADAAQKYDFEMHKAPMWGEAGFLASHSFDELDKYAGETKIAGVFTPGASADWNGVVELSDFSADTLRYWGWVAGTGGLGQFGYQINGGSAIYNDAWTYPDPALEPYMPGGIDHFTRMQIWIPLAGLEGTNTIRTLYKNAEGQEACLAEFTVTLPVTNLQNKFESNVNDNADGTDLQISDLAQYFTIKYGAGDPHVVSGGLYQYGSINDMSAYVDGYYAYVIDMQEAANTAMAFVRGTRVVHSVDLPEMDVDAGLYPINDYYETDGNGTMGGAGIYAAIYNGRLNLMIKAFTPDGRTHIANKLYNIKAEGTELTIADNGETVYFLVNGKLMATVALSGETEYDKLTNIAEGVKFAQTAVVTLADGTTDTIENTLVVSTHKSELGIAVRPATMKFSSIKVLGFNDVVIPDGFYVPEVKENIALNKPVDADSVENDTNIPSHMTDGDETTRWGALPNGVANVVVDLKAVYTLSGMDILFENASWNYEIALSTDGENYTKIYDGAPHAAKMVSLEGTVDARYIKFTRTQDDGATHYWFSIYELYVYGTLKDGEVDPTPDQPEAPKNVVIDLATIEGHQTSNNFGYDCPILTIGYDKVFFLGDIDLNQYSQIIIEYSYDGDTVVEGKPVEQNWTECGRAPIIGFTALNKSFGFANITNQDAIDNGIYTDLPYTPGTWAAASRTAVIEIPENIGYNGPCYLSAYNPWFREIAVSSITLVPRVVDEPDEPAKGEFIQASNDELRIMGTDNVTQIGQAFAPGQFDGWNKVLTLEEGSFGGLIDWGWVAVNSTAYEFGYIINGAEIFSPLFNGPADPNVDAVITALGANNGGRFLGMCAAQALPVGENNVKFAVKLDGGVTHIIREYTVIVTAKEVPHEHSYEAVVTDPTCTEGGYTTYTCGCGDSYVADEVAAAGHNFVDGACGICGEADPDYVPAGPAEITIPEANAIAGALENNALTAEKYIVKGTIVSIDNTTYGNFYIADADGNQLYIYGAYSADGSIRFDKMDPQPKVGDTVTLLGALTIYNGKNEMKNAWVTELIAGEVETPTDPTELTDIPTLNAIGNAQPDKGAATNEKYLVKGTITSIANTQYGNFYIADEAGNTLYVYGLYSADGSIRFDKLDPQPKVGDVVTIMGAMSNYNGAQMKNAWLMELVPGTTEPDPEPEEPDENAITIDFSSKDNRIEYSTSKQVWANGAFILTNNKAASTNDVGDYANPARFYKGSELIFSYAGMTKLVIESDSASSNFNYLKSSLDAAGIEYTVDGYLVIIEFATPVDTFTFSATAGQIRFKSVTAYVAPADEPEAPAGESFTVTTTDTYAWFVDEYTFTAPVAGTYTFLLPEGLGFMSLTANMPEVDFQDPSYSGSGIVVVDLAEGAAYAFTYSAATKDTFTITWTVEEKEISGDEPDSPDTPDAPVEDISGTYTAVGYWNNTGTLVIDTMMGTVVFTNDSGSFAYLMVINEDNTVTLYNETDVNMETPINPIFVALELDNNGAPVSFTYNGNGYELFVGGSVEPDEPDEPVVGDNVLNIGSNSIVVTDEIITNGGVEYTFTVEAEGQYTFEGDFWVQIYNGFGMQVGMGSAFLSEGTYTVNLGTFLISEAGSYTLTVVYAIPEEPDQPDQPSGNTAIESLPFTYEVTAEGLDMDGVYYDYTATEEVTLIITKPEGGYVSLTATNNWSDDDFGNYILVVNAGETINLNFWSMSGITTGSFTVNVYVAEA